MKAVCENACRAPYQELNKEGSKNSANIGHVFKIKLYSKTCSVYQNYDLFRNVNGSDNLTKGYFVFKNSHLFKSSVLKTDLYKLGNAFSHMDLLLFCYVQVFRTIQK